MRSTFHKIATNATYVNLHDKAVGLVEKFGGKAALHVARKAEEAAKGLVGRGMIFEEFGLSYFGPIDGHNLPLLIETFKFLKTQNKPVVLHAITQKGRGFQPALEGQKKFHGLGPYHPETGETKPNAQKTYSEIFAETLVKLADANDKVVAITAAMPNGTALDLFRPHHPTRYFDVGIAEEHAVIFAAGMATKGYKPFCAIYSTFLQRAYDQIVHDVCLQNLPVVFCMDRGGLSGDDGPTHHGLFDISYLRNVPNLVHMVPRDEDSLGRHDVYRDAALRALRHSLSARDRAGDSDQGAAAGARDWPRRGAARRLRRGHLCLRRDDGRRRTAGRHAGGAGAERSLDRSPVRQADRL